MTTLPRSFLVAALALTTAASLQAQTPPPAPVRDTARARLRPQVTPPPAATRPSAGTPAAAPVQTATVRPAGRPSALPPESVAPRPAAPQAVQAAQAIPANAAARCADGSYVQDVGACAARGGVVVLLPRTTPPQRPAGTQARPAAAQAAVRPSAPPAGATMQCKDGTYLSGPPSADRCVSNGGVAAILPAPRQAPAAPERARP